MSGVSFIYLYVSYHQEYYWPRWLDRQEEDYNVRTFLVETVMRNGTGYGVRPRPVRVLRRHMGNENIENIGLEVLNMALPIRMHDY
jgi:hypothetical protein